MNLRKLLFLFYFVLFCAATGWAEDWSVSLPKATPVVKVNGTAANNVVAATSASDNTHWYVLQQKRGNLTPAFDNGLGNNIMRASGGVNTIITNGQTLVSDVAQYLVRFIPGETDGTYKIQFATGRYFGKSLTTCEYSDAGNYSVYNINNENQHIGINLTADNTIYGNIVDNNGAGNNLSFWSTGQVTSTNGNNDWQINEVTFESILDNISNRAISLNYNNSYSAGYNNGLNIVPPYAWNNLSDKTGNSSDLVTWNGSTTETLESNWTVTWNAGATWYYTTNIPENILSGYLDDNDNNQATVTLSNLPFTSGYDLYIYKAADSNEKFSSVTVTFDNHSHSYSTDGSGIAYFGTGQWGQSQQPTSALGTNVICVKGLTAQDITIKGGKRSDGRGAIAAVQLVETGNSRVINVTEDSYDATTVDQPIYLVKDGDLAVTVPNETFSNKYVDVQGVTGTVTYNYTELEIVIKEKKETLKATLDNIAQYVGTNVGQITTNSYYDEARALIGNADATLEQLNAELAHEATYYYAVNMPQEGVGYLLKNKEYSTYLYNENSQLWNRTTPSLVYFEAVEGQSNQFYIKIGEQYVGACTQSNAVMMQDEKANARPYSFDNYQGYVILHDMTANNRFSYLHAVTSDNNKVVGWETAAQATLWSILTPEESVAEAKAILTAEISKYNGNIGTNPGQYNDTDNSAKFNAAKEVANNSDATLEEILTQISSIYNAYSQNPFVAGYYRFRNASRENAYLCSDGSNIKWKALDESDASMIWHISAVNGNGLTVSNYGDDKIPQATAFNNAIAMGETENTTITYENISYGQVKIKFNNAQGAYASDNGNVINYNTGANELGAWYVEPVDYVKSFEALDFTEADKFDITESSTVVYPSEFRNNNLTPQGINKALDSYLAVNTLEEKKAFMESEDGQYLTKYRNLRNAWSSLGMATVKVNMKAEWGTLIVPFSVYKPEGMDVYSCNGVEANNTTLTLESASSIVANTPYIIHGTVGSSFTLIGWDQHSTANHTNGILTGVLGDGKYVPKDSYILAKRGDKIGFYQVADDNIKAAAKNKCYLTLPASTSASAPAFFFPSDDDLTGIDSNITATEDGAIYNLQGLKVTETVKGQIYIKNHKLFKAN